MNITESQKIIDREIKAIVDTIYQNRDNDEFYYKGTFNTKDLPHHNNYSYYPNQDKHFRNVLFERLDKITANHCLYWFELESEEKAKEFNGLLNNYRKVEGCKTVPATSRNKNSKVLYLGVRQGGYRKRDNLTNITGRMLQHLGYYKEAGTQGLQIYEYAKESDFNLTIKIVEFEGLKPYALNVIEKLLAKEMKPICGRH